MSEEAWSDITEVRADGEKWLAGTTARTAGSARWSFILRPLFALFNICLALAFLNIGCDARKDERGEEQDQGPPSGYPLPGGPKAVDVLAGAESTCVRFDDGTLKCWGRNSEGEHARLRDEDQHLLPVELPVNDVVSFAFDDGANYVLGGGLYKAENVACAATQGDKTSCWGSNYGHWGNQENDGSSTPETVEALSGITGLSFGRNIACGLDDGAVKCWGQKMTEVLSLPDPKAAFSPHEVPNISSPVDVACADLYCCALEEAGGVKCWGEGFGKPTQPEFLPPRVVTLDAEGEYYCVALKDGSTGCGDTHNEKLHPVHLDGKVTQVALDRYRACGIDVDGGVHCWCLPQSDESTCTEPWEGAAVSLPDGAVDVAVGQDHTCVLLNDGRVFCWGSNRVGQLGDGTIENRAEPTLVKQLYQLDNEGASPDLMLPTAAAPWPEGLPGPCADLELPSDATFDTHAVEVEFKARNEGGATMVISVANHPRPNGEFQAWLRGEQQVLRLEVEQDEIVAKSGDTEARRGIVPTAGEFSGERGTTRRVRATLLTREGYDLLHGGNLTLMRAGEDGICGTFKIGDGAGGELVGRFATTLDGVDFPSASPDSVPMVPRPSSVKWGRWTLVAQQCETPELQLTARSPYAVSKGIAVQGDDLVIIDDLGRLVKLRVAKKDPCVLELVDSFGEGGKLLLPSEVRTIRVDEQNRLYAITHMDGHYRLRNNGDIEVHCELDGDVIPIRPDKALMFDSWGFDAAVGVIEYQDQECKRTRWPWGDHFRDVDAAAVVPNNVAPSNNKVVLGLDEDEDYKHHLVSIFQTSSRPGFNVEVSHQIEDVHPCLGGVCTLDLYEHLSFHHASSGRRIFDTALDDLLGVSNPTLEEFAVDGPVFWTLAGVRREEGRVADGFIFRITTYSGDAPSPGLTQNRPQPAEGAHKAAGGPASDADALSAVEESAPEDSPDSESNQEAPSAETVASTCETVRQSIRDFGDDCSALAKRLHRKLRGTVRSELTAQ